MSDENQVSGEDQNQANQAGAATAEQKTASENKAAQPKAKPKSRNKRKNEPAVAKQEVTGDAVMISSKQPRRRAGMRFGPKPKRVLAEEISEEQRKALMDDPLIIIQPDTDDD